MDMASRKPRDHTCLNHCTLIFMRGSFSGVSRGDAQGAQGAQHPPEAQIYIQDLLRYLSLYQQVLPQTIMHLSMSCPTYHTPGKCGALDFH